MLNIAKSKAPNIAIITGASSGLGLEFARQLDTRGLDEIWLVARNEQKLNEIAKTLKTPAIAVPADLSSTADVTTIADKIAEEGINVKYLINCAGFGRFGRYDKISDEDTYAMIDLNCKGLVAMTRACLPHMKRGGHIIEVASVAAFMPLPYMNIYAATKAFVLHYTRALRWELHGRGISVTALCPYWVDTNFVATARKSDATGKAVHSTPFAQTPKEVVERALCANRAHVAVACASPISCAMRLVGKVVPRAITMAGWNIIRKL
jgi:short-subunit dehydrogenase